MRYKFDIVKNRNRYFMISIIITLIGILSLAIFGLNKGVDFKAGTTLDITVPGKTLEKIQVVKIINDSLTYQPSTTTIAEDRASARFDKVLTMIQVNTVMDAFDKFYGVKVEHEESTVDTELANELAIQAIVAVLIASLGIMLYIIIRFEWRFALSAVVGLFHDAFMVIAIFSIFRWEVNLPFVAAVLTIIGYSINDKIVVFDRVRENLRFAKIKGYDDLSELVNRSIWQTMSRNINTIMTVLIGAVCLFVFGSEGIRIFSLAMIVGLISGAYSSIFIASPLWLVMKNKSVTSARKVLAAKE
ncbi:protein translocase subunit SecF [Paenibacillus psychroresistens]|uniref:Protein-export membrane protein SecF n=1 Tax=Paenibacillus psychroresistens TaxID=1778678 RepID=A0A6B8RIJ9_9BACL|nr:protein translocase subunit SecF [Paenibacillus psychroresistens]QGQ95425.1 protein translocase subunit SecF [Paenibacillus psychroresistens]